MTPDPQMSGGALLPFPARAFQEALAQWYEREGRPLPWRLEVSVYRTVVSEFMCQQTQVATVLPYFDRWMKRFPNFVTLAAADEEAVLKLWEGLGYYRRARNLQQLAKEVAGMPALPRSTADWQKLPGVGPYTAAAIASIHLGEASPVVDGNVVRVLARVLAESREFKDGGNAVRHFGPAAAELIDPENPGRHNQAMMELGATLCRKQQPLCTVCPVLRFCRAGQRGDAGELPRFAPRKVKTVTVDRLWLEDRGGKALLLTQISREARRLAGQWQLPEWNDLAGVLKLEGPDVRLKAQRTRGIANECIIERIWEPIKKPAADALGRIGNNPGGVKHLWLPWQALAEITLSGPHRRWINELKAF